ncbi:MAG: Tab2/Atab2 family RNA-binding protein [Microcystaceae cyanobacterium]
MGKIWELDFYSRPIYDENKKKVWEVLICESPTEINQSLDSLFRYSQFCPSSTVNSLWLKEAIEKAIVESGETPQKIRFFRRQMNNMITKGCEDAGIVPLPSRRTLALNRWIKERMTDFYPNQEGYDEKAASNASVQYPASNPVSLPDAVKGDKGDRWALVSLDASALQDLNDWEIGFSEALPITEMEITPETRIPGLLIFSPRALPLAAWMSGLDLAYLTVEMGSRPILRLETGLSESWILANVTDNKTLAEAEGFEKAKKAANGLHFLGVQSNPDEESFAGFWLLYDGESL